MNIDKQTFNTLDVLYDDKKWGKRIDPDEWNANFKVLEEGHNELATKLNQQVADIDTAIQAATSDGGQNISVQYGVGTETLQDALDNVVSDINNRYTKNEVDASIGSNTNSLIANAEYNESTGVFTFTRKDGSSVVIDTVIEKVPASMALVNESDGSVSLVVTNQDGSQTKTNVTSLIEDTVINSSDTINATSVTDAVKKVTTYTLVIKPNSIGLSHMDSALTAKFEETQSAKTAAVQAKDSAVAAKTAAVAAQKSAETYASNANTYSTNASVSAGESADSALEAKGYAEQASSYKNSAELAKVAAEKARDEAQSIVGGDFANTTPIIIPSGRMRGDVDGDGKFTLADYNLIVNHSNGISIITDETQLLCADINNDGKISTKDISKSYDLYFDDSKAGAYTEITGNWTNNPNYATEDGQFYADIPITGMTANHSASVIVKGIYESGFFTKAECISGAIRVYAKLCPIEALSAVVSWGTGDGTAVITTESEDLTVYAEHIANADIHVTTEEKAVWSEKDVFIAKLTSTTTDGVTTYSCDKTFDEIKAANDEGKMCILKAGNSIYALAVSASAQQIFFCIANGIVFLFRNSKVGGWTKIDYCNPIKPTSEDAGKILTVGSNGNLIWGAVNNLSAVSATTLLASNWDSTAKTYSFEADYPSASYDIEVSLDGDNATNEQINAWIVAKMLSSSSNKIIAKGTIPTIDIPIILVVKSKSLI